MKSLKEEKKKINEREEEAFQCFLERCENVYVDCGVWALIGQKLADAQKLWIELEEDYEMDVREEECEGSSRVCEECKEAEQA